APNAAAMAPFFARLAYLTPAQKAAAVNFGRFPSDGRAQVASNAGTGAEPQPRRFAPPLAEPVNAARRRPDSVAGRGSGEVAPAVQPSRRFEPQPPPDPDDEDQSGDDAR